MKIINKGSYTQVIGNVKGSSVVITNGSITVNGKLIKDLNELDEKEINIIIALNKQYIFLIALMKVRITFQI